MCLIQTLCIQGQHQRRWGVRSTHNRAAGFGYTYVPPGLRYAREHQDARSIKRRQLLRFAHSAGLPHVPALFSEAAGKEDLEGLFELLVLASSLDGDGSLVAAVIAGARDRHGERVDRVVDAARELRRQHRVAALRLRITDARTRFVMAALLVCPTREAVLRLLEARLGADAQAALGHAVAEMLAEHGGTARRDDIARVVTELMAGATPAEAAARTGAAEPVVRELEQRLRAWDPLRPLYVEER